MRLTALSMLAMAACAPTVPEPNFPGEGVDPGVDPLPVACDDAFEVQTEWSQRAESDGTYRAPNGFVDGGRSFLYTAGMYNAENFRFTARTGKIERRWEALGLPLARNPWVELRTDGFSNGVNIVDQATQEVRGRITVTARQHLGIPVLLDEDRIIAFGSDDGEQFTAFFRDFDGRSLGFQELRDNGVYAPVSADFDSASQRLVWAHPLERDEAMVKSLDEDRSYPLSRHEGYPSDEQPYAPGVHEVDISPDGRWITSVGIDGTARIHDAETREVIATRDVVVSPVNLYNYAPPDTRSPFAWSADSRLLARGIDPETIVVERMCDGEIVATLQTDPSLAAQADERVTAPMTLTFSPDGDVLVAVYERGVQGFVAAD